MIIILWELPQSILALFCYLLYGEKEVKKYKSCYVIKCRKIAGVSLGRFIFLNDYYDNENIIKHEYGHAIQSLIFGWLYLVVIGFFSWGNTHIWRSYWYGKKDYYSLYPERWADILGNTDNRRVKNGQ